MTALRFKRISILIPVFLLLLFGFQNCGTCSGSHQFVKSESSASQSTGNGTSYDGKPDPGQYYRIIPEYKCADRNVIHSEIQVSEEAIVEKSVRASDCQEVSRNLTSKDVEFAPYNNEYVGFGDGIYAKRDQAPDLSRPEQRLSEAWCRLKSAGPDYLDLVVEESLPEKQLTAKIRRARRDERAVFSPLPELAANVTRDLTAKRLKYQSADLSLEIDLSTSVGAQDEKFSGKVSLKEGPSESLLDVECRIGSWVDKRSQFTARVFLDFASGFLPSSISFTRGSVGTYFDATGVLRVAQADGPRFDYDSISKKALGLAVESSATNLVAFSQRLDAAQWGRQENVVVTPNTAVAPDGTMSADTLSDPTTTAVSYMYYESNLTNQGGVYTASAFVKRGTSPGITVSVWFLSGGGTTVSHRVRLNWNNTQLVFDSNPLAAGLQDVGNGWYRMWVTDVDNASGNTRVRINIEPAGLYPSDTGTVLVWGAQLEASPIVTSYIPTDGTVITRQADLVQLASTQDLSGTRGTFLVEASRPLFATDSRSASLLSMVDGTAAEYGLYFDPASHFRARVVASDWSVTGLPQPAGSELQRIGLRYQTGDATLVVNGTSAQGPANVQTSLVPTGLILGGTSAAQKWNGHVKSVLYGNEVMDTASLIKLTSGN